MKMEHIEESIFNYIKSDSPYALLIDGDWGTGKTHYISNTIIPKIEKKGVIRPIKISMYGYDNLKDIKKSVENEILGNNELLEKAITTAQELDSDFAKGAGNAANFLKSRFNSKKLIESVGKIILIVDDLERISTEIELNDALGMIHSEFMEKLGLKVIFITNSKEIKNIDFKKIKEKVIDKTLQFKPTIEFSLDEILKTNSNSFFMENKDWIYKMISKFNESLNLRTFQTIFSNFNYLDNVITKKLALEDKDIVNKIRKSLFLNIMVLTKEAKEHKELNVYFDSSIAKTLFFDSRYISSANDLKLEDLLGNKDTKENKDSESSRFKNQINEVYHNKEKEFDNHIFYFNGVDDYILHGFYDEKLFEKSFEKWHALFFPIEDLGNIKYISNFKGMKDTELKDRQVEIFNKIKNGDYSFQDLLEVYSYYIIFNENDLFLIEETFEEVEAIIVDKLLIKYQKASREDISRFSLYKDQYRGEEWINNLDVKFSKQEKSRLKEEYSKILDEVFSGNYKEKNSKRGNEIIFELLSENTYLDDYILCVDGNSEKLRYFLSGETFTKENISKKSVDKILEKLNRANRPESLGKINNYNIDNLEKEIKKWSSE
ncbi:P-loop NTPase fold protein [Vagococcus carniphilus]|uniref:P-loop NTPase fold protein n=1 Tax=Vagococcus carniphilus TaxID=218144 RepID=UPI00288CA65B|nr:P-loop NTPase fold protein [Vagococcus carniphilus]MDT2814780.1 hypothetical protein [Vagococcus carniphilus]MDT2864821.1 hypothetical protein [Vagococcus carniphilus]